MHSRDDASAESRGLYVPGRGNRMQDQSNPDRNRVEDDRPDQNTSSRDNQPEPAAQQRDSQVRDAQPDAAKASPEQVADLVARAESAEQRVRDINSRFDQLRNELQRQSEETRQRLNRNVDEQVLGAKIEFVSALLPVLDNLMRALETATTAGSPAGLLDGLERTILSFENALARVGVEPVGSVGQRFDPQVHEAVDTVQVPQGNNDVVTREYSKGYRLGDRLLRPSRVQVGSAQVARGNKA
jgi:molecular chaperone GrpE